MKVVSNLDNEQHLKLENWIISCNTIPLMFNFFEEYEDKKYGSLETYKLIKLEIYDNLTNIIYEKIKLKESSLEKKQEFKQLKLI